MKPIRTFNDLVAVVRKHMPTKAGVRAIDEGTVAALGGFNPVLGPYPGWILHVASEGGQEWIMRVHLNAQEHHYGVSRIAETEIPWESWVGPAHNEGAPAGLRRIWVGDFPSWAERIQNDAQNAHTQRMLGLTFLRGDLNDFYPHRPSLASEETEDRGSDSSG